MSEFATRISHRTVPCGSVVPQDRPASERRGLLARLRHHAEAGTLAAVPVGGRVQISGLGGDLEPEAIRRLVDLGFAPGATVEVLRRAPLVDPTIFRVADTEIALRRRHAEAVHVVEITDVDEAVGAPVLVGAAAFSRH